VLHAIPWHDPLDLLQSLTAETIRLAVQLKEANHLVHLIRDVVRHPLCQKPLKQTLVPVHALRPPPLGIVLHHLGRLSAGPQHRRPQLDLLVVVLHVEHLVIGPVEKLHLGPRAGVPGVHGRHHVRPAGAVADDLAGGAGVGPDVVPVAGEAPRGHARKGRAGGEEVRVGAEEDVGHHGAGADARDEDAVRVDVVVGQGPARHAGNAEGVAAGIVPEGLLRGHVPAVVGRPWSGRVDGDEAELVGKSAPGFGVEGGGGIAVTPVRVDEERRLGLEAVRHVEVEGGVGGIRTEVFLD